MALEAQKITVHNAFLQKLSPILFKHAHASFKNLLRLIEVDGKRDRLIADHAGVLVQKRRDTVRATVQTDLTQAV